jgi:hypothetical protein
MALTVGTLADSIYNDVFMLNGLDENENPKGPSSTYEFADLFVPIFIDWFETAEILVTGAAVYTPIPTAAVVTIPGADAPLVNSILLSESDLKSALKEDLDSGTEDVLTGGIAAKGWPKFSAKVTQNIAGPSGWVNSNWTTSDIQISGGSCFSFLFALHETEPTSLRASADDLAAALHSGILSYTVSSTLGASHIPSDAAVVSGTLVFTTGATVANKLE